MIIIILYLKESKYRRMMWWKVEAGSGSGREVHGSNLRVRALFWKYIYQEPELLFGGSEFGSEA